MALTAFTPFFPLYCLSPFIPDICRHFIPLNFILYLLFSCVLNICLSHLSFFLHPLIFSFFFSFCRQIPHSFFSCSALSLTPSVSLPPCLSLSVSLSLSLSLLFIPRIYLSALPKSLITATMRGELVVDRFPMILSEKISTGNPLSPKGKR